MALRGGRINSMKGENSDFQKAERWRGQDGEGEADKKRNGRMGHGRIQK